MTGVTNRDLLGGVLLVVLGAGAALYSYLTLDLGTLNRMGPGMFPMAVGLLLAGFGSIIAVQGVLARVDPGRFEFRVTVFVIAAVVSFGLLVRAFGLVPAVVVLVAIASRADGKASRLQVVVLAAGVSAATWLIFVVGLGLPLVPFRLPF